jgi:hypothetical protein
MRKFCATLLITVGLTVPVPVPVQASASCSNLSVPAVADDGLTVTLSAVTLTEKPGSIQLAITYKLQNLTTDKKIDEGSFALFFKDGSSMPQYGFFGTLFPSDSKERTHQWEYLKGQEPIAIQYNSGFGSGKLDAAKLYWGIPGFACPSVSYDSNAAANEVLSPRIDGTCLEIGKTILTSEGELTCVTKESTLSLSLASSSCTILANGDAVKLQTCIANSYKGKVSWKLSRSKAEIDQAADAALAAAEKADAAKTAAQEVADKEAAAKAAAAKAAAAKAAASKKTTITCVKGKLSKKVSAVNPKCPTGYKKK